LYVLYI